MASLGTEVPGRDQAGGDSRYAYCVPAVLKRERSQSVSAHSLTVFDDGRTATRLPGGARLGVGLLLLRRSRRSGANGSAAIDLEVCFLAGGKRTSVGDGVPFGCVPVSGGPRRCHCVSSVSMVRRK